MVRVFRRRIAFPIFCHCDVVASKGAGTRTPGRVVRRGRDQRLTGRAIRDQREKRSGLQALGINRKGDQGSTEREIKALNASSKQSYLSPLDVISLSSPPLATFLSSVRMDPSHYSGLCYPTTDNNGLSPLQHQVTDPGVGPDWDPPLHQYYHDGPTSHHARADYPPLFPAQYMTVYNPVGISPILDDWHQLLAV